MGKLVVSYSRADQPQVRAVVSLLKSAMRDIDEAVFWDGDFAAGDPWFAQLTRHIDTAPQLFVFWCHHAQDSSEVRREFEYAFAQRKRVVPVLLDDTPLAAELAPLQGIDLRGAVRHGGAGFFRYISKLAVAASLLVALVITGAALGLRSSDRELPPPISTAAPVGAGPTGLPGPGPIVAVTPEPPALALARAATAATAAALVVLAAAAVYQRRQLVRRFRQFL